MDNQFVKSYTSFIGMLVSARPEYLSLVLEKIVQGLTYSACDCPSFLLDLSTDLPKVLELISLTLLCQNPRLLPLQDA
jgi:hypothetical protein